MFCFLLFVLFTLKIRFLPFITSSVDLRLERSSYFTDLHYVLYLLVPATYWRSQENSKALSFELLNCLYCNNRVLSTSYRPFIAFCSFNFFAPVWFLSLLCLFTYIYSHQNLVCSCSALPSPPTEALNVFYYYHRSYRAQRWHRDSSNINKVVIIIM